MIGRGARGEDRTFPFSNRDSIGSGLDPSWAATSPRYQEVIERIDAVDGVEGVPAKLLDQVLALAEDSPYGQRDLQLGQHPIARGSQRVDSRLPMLPHVAQGAVSGAGIFWS